MAADMPEELLLLGQLLSPFADSLPLKHYPPDCWSKAYQLANKHYLATALSHALLTHGVTENMPPDYLAFIQEMHQLNSERNNSLRQQLLELIGTLNRVGIRPLLLKGASSLLADEFPNPGIRFLVDLDLFVDPHELDSAISALESIGYASPAEYLSTYNPALAKHYPPLFRESTPATVELHFKLFDRNAKCLFTVNDIYSQGRIEKQYGVEYSLMSPNQHILYTIFHAMIHHRLYDYHVLPLRECFHYAHLLNYYGRAIDRTNIQSV
ncbi:MAG: nucleotidyltransferase family protein, partial [Magnetococcales bacterium]|nr:nucleotidyltransferase family protein [Magnetococcales bacterium]